MKVTVLKSLVFTIVLLSISWNFLTALVKTNTIEIDKSGTVARIVDGDTFNISSGDTIRLADVDTPEWYEYGSSEATNALNLFLRSRKVFLDIDDIYRTDRYGRLVCVVYVVFNSTHYLNVNKALLAGGFASLWDHTNEFNPATRALSLILYQIVKIFGRFLMRAQN